MTGERARDGTAGRAGDEWAADTAEQTSDHSGVTRIRPLWERDEDAGPIEPRVWDVVRAGIDGRAARAMGAAAVIVVLATVVAVWWNRPAATPVPPLPAVASARESTEDPGSAGESATSVEAPTDASAGSVGPSGTAVSPAPAAVVVSVVGLVERPGVVTLAGGARVADAVAAAGGPSPNADTLSLNLARPVADGEQIVVGVMAADPGPLASAVITGAAAGTTPGPPGSTQSPGSGSIPAVGPLSLTTASPAELETLPGVGPVTAAAIVQWRTDNGPFSSVEQLAEVPGIGPARLSKLQPLVVP